MTYFEQIPVALVKKLLKSNIAKPPTGGENSQLPPCKRLIDDNKAKAASVSQKRPILVVPFSGLR
jgi:hypothetical protein